MMMNNLVGFCFSESPPLFVYFVVGNVCILMFKSYPKSGFLVVVERLNQVVKLYAVTAKRQVAANTLKYENEPISETDNKTAGIGNSSK